MQVCQVIINSCHRHFFPSYVALQSATTGSMNTQTMIFIEFKLQVHYKSDDVQQHSISSFIWSYNVQTTQWPCSHVCH